MTTPGVRITYQGRLVYTVEQIMARYGRGRDTVLSIIRRAALEPVAQLDGKKHLYDAAAVRAAIEGRPGKGWRQGTGYVSAADRAAERDPDAAGNP